MGRSGFTFVCLVRGQRGEEKEGENGKVPLGGILLEKLPLKAGTRLYNKNKRIINAMPQ